MIKKGDIIKYSGQIYVVVDASGRGSRRVFLCAKDYETAEMPLSELEGKHEVPVDEVKKSIGKYEKEIENEIPRWSVGYAFWEAVKNTNPSIENLIIEMVNKFGHPWNSEGSWNRQCFAMSRAIIKDYRTRQDITDAWLKNGALFLVNGQDNPDLSSNELEKQAEEYLFQEMKKYVNGPEEDIRNFSSVKTVVKYYGGGRKKRIKVNGRNSTGSDEEIESDKEGKN